MSETCVRVTRTGIEMRTHVPWTKMPQLIDVDLQCSDCNPLAGILPRRESITGLLHKELLALPHYALSPSKVIQGKTALQWIREEQRISRVWFAQSEVK